MFNVPGIDSISPLGLAQYSRTLDNNHNLSHVYGTRLLICVAASLQCTMVNALGFSAMRLLFSKPPP